MRETRSQQEVVVRTFLFGGKLVRYLPSVCVTGGRVSGLKEWLLRVRDEKGLWSWSLNKVRVIENAMDRLRVGHAPLE